MALRMASWTFGTLYRTFPHLTSFYCPRFELPLSLQAFYLLTMLYAIHPLVLGLALGYSLLFAAILLYISTSYPLMQPQSGYNWSLQIRLLLLCLLLLAMSRLQVLVSCNAIHCQPGSRASGTSSWPWLPLATSSVQVISMHAWTARHMVATSRRPVMRAAFPCAPGMSLGMRAAVRRTRRAETHVLPELTMLWPTRLA